MGQPASAKQSKTHDDYLLSVGHEYYNCAREADSLGKCLYWLDRYYEENQRLIARAVRKELVQRRQQMQVNRLLNKALQKKHVR